MDQDRDCAGRPAGKRVKKGMGAGAKALIALVCTAAALFGGYASLCAWAGSRIPDGTVVQLEPGVGEVPLGGLSQDEAAQLLASSMEVDAGAALTVLCGEYSARLGADVLAPDPDAVLDTLAQAAQLAARRPFLSRGLYFLVEQAGSTQPVRLRLPCAYRFSEEGEAQVDRLLEELSREAAAPPSAPTYTVGTDSVEVTCGSAGAALDAQQAKAEILRAFQEGRGSVTLDLEEVDPETPDARAIQEEIYVAPEPVRMGADGKAVPPVVGLSLDVESAQAALDAAGPGETVSLPLVRTQPDYSKGEGILFQDLLSECVTKVGGSANRVYNVSLAAQRCNERVLLPGESFSYYDAVGDCSFAVDLGFANGKTVDMVGGGICQMSSSLYYCTIYANLEVVSRTNHAYLVDYLPSGLDATYYGGSLDYSFRNNSPFPVKIVSAVNGRTLTVQFYGLNPNGTYVTTERSQLSSTGYTTIYKPDETLAPGTTKVEITPYVGAEVAVYRCVYAENGTLLSRSLENTSKYSARNRVILYHPDDWASLGLEPPEGYVPPVEPTPEEPQTPVDPAVPEEPEQPPAEEYPEEQPPLEEVPAVEPPVEEPPAAEQPPVSEPPAEEAPAPAESPAQGEAV